MQIVDDFRQAARNAVDAGFDGVEVHGANVSSCVRQLLQILKLLLCNAQACHDTAALAPGSTCSASMISGPAVQSAVDVSSWDMLMPHAAKLTSLGAAAGVHHRPVHQAKAQ